MVWKGFGTWVVIVLWLVATVGGICCTVDDGAWVIALCIVFNAVLAFFKVREMFKKTFDK